MEAANLLGVKQSALSRYLYAEGIKQRLVKPPRERVSPNDIHETVQRERTYRRAAKVLGLSYGAVQRGLNRYHESRGEVSSS